MEKKVYEEPTVQKVEFDFKTRIAASACKFTSVMDGDSLFGSECFDI